MNTINVRDYLPPIDVREERIFIRDKDHNRAAAMHRYSVVDKVTRELFAGINADESDTKDIPQDLVDKYEQLYKLLISVSMYETEIATGVIK